MKKRTLELSSGLVLAFAFYVLIAFVLNNATARELATYGGYNCTVDGKPLMGVVTTTANDFVPMMMVWQNQNSTLITLYHEYYFLCEPYINSSVPTIQGPP